MQNLIPSAVSALLLTICCTNSHAQIKPLVQANQKAAQANATVLQTASTINSTVQTVNLVKSIFGTKKDKVKKGVVLVGVAGIDYDNENLLILQAAIKELKGVSSLEKQLTGGAITLEVKTKESPGNLWDAVPKEIKSLFKLSEAGENTLIIEYKTPQPPADEQQAIPAESKPATDTLKQEIKPAQPAKTDAAATDAGKKKLIRQ